MTTPYADQTDDMRYPSLNEDEIATVERLKTSLERVRKAMDRAIDNTSVSLDGHSLQRQPMDVLVRREAEITWDLQEILGGGPFHAIIVEGRNDWKALLRTGQT